MQRDPYDILGISRYSTEEDIKKAYRDLAKRYHPDNFSDESMRKLAEEKMQLTLSISLHAPNDEIRNKIMKINHRYNLKELIDACKYYIKITGRRISFEYIMIKNVNDSSKCAFELAKLLKNMIWQCF